MRLGATPSANRQLPDAHVDDRADECWPGCLGSRDFDCGCGPENEAEREDRAPAGAVGDNSDHPHYHRNIGREPPTLVMIGPGRRRKDAYQLGIDDQEHDEPVGNWSDKAHIPKEAQYDSHGESSEHDGVTQLKCQARRKGLITLINWTLSETYVHS